MSDVFEILPGDVFLFAKEKDPIRGVRRQPLYAVSRAGVERGGLRGHLVRSIDGDPKHAMGLKQETRRSLERKLKRESLFFPVEVLEEARFVAHIGPLMDVLEQLRRRFPPGSVPQSRVRDLLHENDFDPKETERVLARYKLLCRQFA